MKVIPQVLQESDEVESGASRGGPRAKPVSPLRFTPLTGVLATDAAGQLLVRRIRVRVTAGPDRGRESMLEAGTLLVGTHSDNDLILRDPQVGKYHLEIALVAGGIRVRDLGSESGTFQGLQRITSGVVAVGAELVVGRSTLQLLGADLAVSVPPSERSSFGPVIGHSAPMRQLFALLERVAPTDVPVILEGEPGTGRTLIAKAIHASSRFAASPVTVIDFRQGPSERPSISAIAQRPDTFTLLLERVDEALSSDLSALGSLYERREEGVLDARIIATSSHDLRALSQEPGSKFRKELVAHVAAVRLPVPTLQVRREDIAHLVRQFAKEICGVEPEFEPSDFDRMVAREYPGHVRELRELVVKALQVEQSVPQLPKTGAARARAALVMPLNARPKPPPPKVARDRLLEFFERDAYAQLLAQHDNNYNDVARELAVSRRDLLKKLKSLGFTTPDR
ncbi:MAG: sigma 54-dependent Fis family transcriptional regulator [Myxococcales bacterium]|nr:sigma 54-dependent Fis family transcriptional regulator [Myxococcales bacterium]